MPRFYHSSPERDDSGKVVIERQSDDHVEVFTRLPRSAWKGLTSNPAEPMNSV